jgi:glycosyltransferase involved in cell wall biosynthesis
MSILNGDNVLIVVPAFNEEKSIVAVLRQLAETQFDVLVVSDGSTDNTAGITRQLGVDVVELPYNLGVGGALRVGFQIAVENGYSAVIQVDADGQHPVSHIELLVTCANQTEAHMVVGSRFLSHDTTMSVSQSRQFVMRVLAWSASRAAGGKITDSSSGFRLIRRPLLDHLSKTLSSSYLGDTYESIISAGRSGYLVKEVPAPMGERTTGSSTATVTQAIQAVLKALGIYALRLHTRLASFDSSTH